MRKKVQCHDGFTLLEILIALAIATMLMIGINGAISQGLQAKSYAHEANEMAYSARFALKRIISNLRTASSALGSGPTLSILPAGSTFSIVYTLNAANQLIETDNRTAPATVSVLADHVSVFTPVINKSVTRPGNYKNNDVNFTVGATLVLNVAQIDITLNNDGQSMTVSGYSRIGAF